MAIKSILISSGSAKRAAVTSNRFTYDTDTKYVSIDNISSSQLVLTGAVSGVLISSGGVVTAYKASEYPNNYLISDGIKWVVGSAGSISIGNVSGTLTGSYPNPRFIDITNVNTGSLPVARGGFSGSGNYNLLSSIPSGSLILASGTGSLTVVSTASYSSTGDAWVLASVSGTSVWAAVTASAPAKDANVQFFTCSSPLTSSTDQVWTKMNPNHQWARVMLQGGGGGGGVGPGAASAIAQSGGGAGGFTDIVVYIAHILSASITVGAGALGRDTVANTTYLANSSSFSASNIFISARAGISGSPLGAGAGGVGLTYNGGDGSTQIAPGGASPPGGALGGAGGGASGNPGSVGGKGGLYTTDTTSSVPSQGSNFKPNLYGYNIPIGFGAGGYNGGFNGVYGSGGGGTGNNNNPVKAGNGGDGFVIVVSY